MVLLFLIQYINLEMKYSIYKVNAGIYCIFFVLSSRLKGKYQQNREEMQRIAMDWMFNLEEKKLQSHKGKFKELDH